MDELIRNLFASSGRAFERIGLPQYAASCAKKSGNDAEAQRILYEASIRHEASGKFVKAARCARKSGDDRRAWMMYDRAIEEKEQKGMFLDVARLFEEKGDYASAIACYIDSKVNATLEAARVAFSKLKDPDLASCICEKNGMNMQAAYYATNIGNYEKARKLQEREQDGVNASVLSDLTESGKLKEADEFATQHSITSYLDERQKQIDSQHAFNIYTRHGMVDCIAQEGSEAELKEVLKEYDKKKRYVEVGFKYPIQKCNQIII